MLRGLPRLFRSLSTDVHRPVLSPIPITPREAQTSQIITNPLTNQSEAPAPAPASASLSHPRDPFNSSPRSQSRTDYTDTKSPDGPGTPPPYSSSSSTPSNSNVPSTVDHDFSHAPTYTHPPFHTHAFFTALEKSFPTATARSLMRATRALLVDRVGRVRREGLTVKDLDNVRTKRHAYTAGKLIMSSLAASLSVPCCALGAACGDDHEYQE